MNQKLQLAASFIKNCQYVIIGAGAGMGKDSSLPDYRGNEGFWNDYPPYRGKFDFYKCASPQFLEKRPELFWGFYGSRLQLYRKALPHQGYSTLLNLQKKHGKEIFSVTSNVDGLFAKAGFSDDKIYEVHGNINFLQCYNCQQISQNNFEPSIDFEEMSCRNFPKCQKCKENLRPNILMFDDWEWLSDLSDKQRDNFQNFLTRVLKCKGQVCLLQIGAGTAVPTIRNMLERIYYNNKKAKYVRINPDHQENRHANKERFVHLELSAQKALSELQILLEK